MKKYAKQLLRALSYVAMVVIPVLSGWGVNDLGGYFRDPARAGYVGLGALGMLIVLIPHSSVQPFSKGAQVAGRGLFLAVVVSAFFQMVFLPFADRRGVATFPEGEGLRAAGLALCLAGTVIRLAAVRTLGKQFSGYVTLQENHQLVQIGLYRHIRHPMYLGVVILMPGVALVFRSWLVIPVSILTLVFVLLRMGQEERLLAERFGSEFESYRRRTWRLLPYVY